MKNKKILIIFISIGIILSLAVAYILIWGKLFVCSPIIVGFDRHEFEKVIVYIQKDNNFECSREIDRYIDKVEEFHTLEFKKKPKIFFFSDRRTYARRSISKARFNTFYNGNIVVSPWAQEEAVDGIISMEIYLRHELSHSLLYQHKGMLSSYRYPKWLLEGIATYSSNQMGTFVYPSKDETYGLIREGEFMPPQYFGTKKEDEMNLELDNKMAFIYAEFACIVDYLIRNYGEEKFIKYMKQLLTEDNHDLVFESVFDMDFPEFISTFRESVAKPL